MDIMHELFPIRRSIDRALSSAQIAIPCANSVGNHQATGQARPGQMLPHPEAKGPAGEEGKGRERKGRKRKGNFEGKERKTLERKGALTMVAVGSGRLGRPWSAQPSAPCGRCPIR